LKKRYSTYLHSQCFEHHHSDAIYRRCLYP
jgi:hypothetical protein